MVSEMRRRPVTEGDSAGLLRRHGIPFRSLGHEGGGRLAITDGEVDPDRLREIGFRLGQGRGAIRYLLYHRGQFCGVVMQRTR